MKRAAAGILAMLVAGLVAPGSASAIDKVVTIASDGPGPEAYDNVYVHQMGPKRADRVLVLVPGTIAGAGAETLIAHDLVKRITGLQVWVVDRRSQVLEDTAMFERALAGEVSTQEMYDYYVGWITNGGTPTDHFDFLDTTTVPFAREWGMETALEDMREVVRAAREDGREVILGGHSLGASLSAAYAAWDFDGKPGYREIDGLVLIDGGLLGSFDAYGLRQAQKQIAKLQTSNPFADLLEVGFPEAAGLFAEIGGIFARLEPTAPATLLQSSPLLPAELKPPVPATNRALLGRAFDRDTSPEELAIVHVNAGGLAASGDPRDWADGGITPVARLARLVGQEPSNGVEWYYPTRLRIDTNGANQMKMNDVARFLGLRLKHTDEIDVPIYAFQSDLTDGAVLKGAKRLVKRAATPRNQAMLVNGAPQQSHLDQLAASPGKNEFLKTVIAFLDPHGE